MIIDIQARQFKLSAALKSYVESRIRLSIGRYETSINRVDVSLSDINGPKGGEDMCCKSIIKVRGLPTIVVQEINADMYDSINKCLHRAKRSVKRHVSLGSWKRQKPLIVTS